MCISARVCKSPYCMHVADIRMCMRVCVHVCACLHIVHAVTCINIYIYRGVDGARLKGPFDLEVVFLIFVCVLFSLFPTIFTSMHRRRSTTSSARAAWNTCPMLRPRSLATGMRARERVYPSVYYVYVVCVCVCVYVCMYIYMYIYIHACICICLFIYMMYVYIHVHIQTKVVSALPTLIQDNQKIVVGLLAECCGSSEEVCMYVYDVFLCICMYV